VKDSTTRSLRRTVLAEVTRPTRSHGVLSAEAALAGLAYGSGLCWVSTCVVGSFRPGYLANPYWPAIRGLRTDTCGIAAFGVTTVCLVVSEYLRLRRQRGGGLRPGPTTLGAAPVQLGVLAIARTIGLLSTVLVAYLSANAVTHPATLAIQATHLVPWPTEGTLRVFALIACVCSVGITRWMRVSLGGPT
jgi:hypothetical protein